jgi:hypothetical protein
MDPNRRRQTDRRRVLLTENSAISMLKTSDIFPFV